MNEKYTPMVQQYRDVKEEHPDELLFFRLGDFYELFFEDAVTASRELGLTLTGRAGGLTERIPMCGVPYHSVEGYIAKLVRKGYKLAICEQMEDPKLAKGLVKRDVTKIITPGTVLSDNLLDGGHNSYLGCLMEGGKGLCLAYADVSTGECHYYLASGSEALTKVLNLLGKLQVAELICAGSVTGWETIELAAAQKAPGCLLSKVTADLSHDYFAQHFPESDVASPLARTTVEALLAYVHEHVKADLGNINELSSVAEGAQLSLDVTAIRNLELIRNMRDGGKQGTLLAVLDKTRTAMGARLLRQWIESPLLDCERIKRRQEAISYFLGQASLRESLSEALSGVTDLERIMSRIEVGSANARDLASLRTALGELPNLRKLLSNATSSLLTLLVKNVQDYSELQALLSRSIVDEPPFTVREGGMIRDGFSPELDELRVLATDNKEWMQDFEAKIRTQCAERGVKNLKIGFNKIFGYYIEVSKGQADLVPASFVRKQTLVNAERFIVPELKEYENKVLGAKERIGEVEYYLFNKVRDEVRKYLREIQTTAHAIAEIDVLLALAQVADKNNYVCPALNQRGELKIKDGRHPVVEKLLNKELFVPNDTYLDRDTCRMVILTGPNMAGKSTYMRQVALIVLMAQMGSFVPARSADICPVDKIFTRVGASDDLATGQSTFMVEMNEVAHILREATVRSLIILDEVGRGTSTYDGMSIARSVMEYIHSKIKAKTLFATHYHELISMEEVLPGVKNYSVAVKERGNEVVFLRRIVPGGTDRSYGIHVARLAGLPKAVTRRADELLEQYASGAPQGSEKAALPQKVALEEPSLFTNVLRERILQLDVMSLTPIEALNELYKLQEQARKEEGR